MEKSGCYTEELHSIAQSRFLQSEISESNGLILFDISPYMYCFLESHTRKPEAQEEKQKNVKDKIN